MLIGQIQLLEAFLNVFPQLLAEELEQHHNKIKYMKLFLKYTFICFIAFFHINTFAQSIYDGGNGDGFTKNCYSQADNIAFNIYNGGNSDGFAIDCYTQADNIAFNIYDGGNSDGFAIDCYTQLDNPLFFIYSGGQGDGNSIFCAGTITEIPLPIELIDFKAILVDNFVQLNWQTASEINNDYFTVEKSINATNWVGIIKINGAGNSNTVLTYSTVDNTPYNGVSYYRLKQTDFDGHFEYSKIRSINLNSVSNNEVQVYPNPTNSQINIVGNKFELGKIKVLNTLGQDVSTIATVVHTNKSTATVDLSNLSKGIYYVKTKTTTKKVLKQ